MKLLQWLRRKPQATAAEPCSLSPIEVYEANGKRLEDAPPMTQRILQEAERSHRARLDT